MGGWVGGWVGGCVGAGVARIGLISRLTQSGGLVGGWVESGRHGEGGGVIGALCGKGGGGGWAVGHLTGSPVDQLASSARTRPDPTRAVQGVCPATHARALAAPRPVIPCPAPPLPPPSPARSRPRFRPLRPEPDRGAVFAVFAVFDVFGHGGALGPGKMILGLGPDFGPPGGACR